MVENQNKSNSSSNNLNSSCHSTHSHDGYWRNFTGGEESLNNSFHLDVDLNNDHNNNIDSRSNYPYENLNNAEDRLHNRGRHVEGLGLGLHHLHSSLPNLMRGCRSSDNLVSGSAGIMRDMNNSRSNFMSLDQRNVNNAIAFVTSRSGSTANLFQSGNNSNNGRNSSFTNLQRNMYISAGADNVTSTQFMQQEGSQTWYNNSNINNLHNSTSALFGSNNREGNNIRNNLFLNAMSTPRNNNFDMRNQQQQQQHGQQHEAYGEETTLQTEPASDHSSVASFDQDDLQQIPHEQPASNSIDTAAALTNNNMMMDAWGTQSCPDMKYSTRRRNSMLGSDNGQFLALPLCLESNEERDGSYASPQRRTGRFLAYGRQNELLTKVGSDTNANRIIAGSEIRRPTTADLLGSLPNESCNSSVVRREEQDGFGSMTNFQQQQQQQQYKQQQNNHYGMGWTNQSCPDFGYSKEAVELPNTPTLAPLEQYFNNDDWEEITSPSCVFASPASKPRLQLSVENQISSDMLIDESNQGDFKPMPFDSTREGSTELSASDFQSDFLLNSINSIPLDGSSQSFNVNVLLPK
jgi:hypothetical protein